MYNGGRYDEEEFTEGGNGLPWFCCVCLTGGVIPFDTFEIVTAPGCNPHCLCKPCAKRFPLLTPDQALTPAGRTMITTGSLIRDQDWFPDLA